MSKFKTSDNVEICYQAKGEGKPIVLVHGWSQTKEVFAAQIEALSKNFKVISYDHRGHGESERTQIGLTLDRLAKDLKELIEHLELDKVLVAGWSMGASTIFNYVKDYGVEHLAGIVLFDMTPKLLNDDLWKMGLWHGQYTLDHALVDMTTIANDFADFGAPFFKRVAPYMSQEMIDGAMVETMKNTPHVMNAFWLAMAVNDYRDILKDMTVPTVIAYGEKSTLYSADTAEYLNQQIPHSKLEGFPGCTHLLVMENPDKASGVIAELAAEVF